MKLLQRFTTATILLASTAIVSAQMAPAQQGQNDSVDYSPKVKTVAGPLPLDTHYTLEVSAPTHLNNKGEEALKNGLPAELRVNVASFPEGSNPAAALAVVSVDPSGMTFYKLGEKLPTTVRIVASANTTPGDYMYNIQAVGPEGMGWGSASATLTVTVSEPVASDVTAPGVIITKPTAKQEVVFCTGGTTVPVTISAVDAESPVTAVGFWVNAAPITVDPFASENSVVAQGQFVAAAVGAYELGGWATSAGGTGTSPVVGVSVNYTMSWLPPVSAGRTLNGAVPIKFAARDCVGKFVADSSVRVEVWEMTAQGPVKQFVALHGEGSGAVRIQETDEHYIANFHPPSGSRTYTVKVFFNEVQQADTNFKTR
jgi:hypothetical protein